MEEAMKFEASGGQQVLRPLSQRPSQPAINWHAESHLGTFDQLWRNILIQDLTQYPLAIPIANLKVQRQLPRELYYAMVEHGDPRFKANRHAGPVHFGKNVVGQVIEQVGQH